MFSRCVLYVGMKIIFPLPNPGITGHRTVALQILYRPHFVHFVPDKMTRFESGLTISVSDGLAIRLGRIKG